MNEKVYKGCYMTNTKGISFKECKPQTVVKSVFKERKENSYKCLMKPIPRHS